jgi:hypothetical protein
LTIISQSFILIFPYIISLLMLFGKEVPHAGYPSSLEDLGT